MRGKYKHPPKFHLTLTAEPPYDPGKQVAVTCNSFQLSGIITDAVYDEINFHIGWLIVQVQGEPIRFARLSAGYFVADVEKQIVDNGATQGVQISLF